MEAWLYYSITTTTCKRIGRGMIQQNRVFTSFRRTEKRRKTFSVSPRVYLFSSIQREKQTWRLAPLPFRKFTYLLSVWKRKYLEKYKLQHGSVFGRNDKRSIKSMRKKLLNGHSRSRFEQNLAPNLLADVLLHTHRMAYMHCLWCPTEM